MKRLAKASRWTAHATTTRVNLNLGLQACHNKFPVDVILCVPLALKENKSRESATRPPSWKFQAPDLEICLIYLLTGTSLSSQCGRIGMMMGLSVLYPQHLFAFQLLVCLEIAGCWSNHYRCMLTSNPTEILQKSRSTDPWILRIFFQEPICSLVICGQDTCVAMCYLLYFSPGPSVTVVGSSHSLWRLLAWLGAPFLVYRQVVVCGLLVVNSFSELGRLHHPQNQPHKEHSQAFREKTD
ncbi:uncharacterized protein [Acropora muricata]|uniref:uncharacterized protein isoform X2 n=1 Tax=Acropora muricata TaxID=159855 RepID=UPI0034E53373